ncbi:MAG: tetratricopeptide repeat protein [Chlorobium sp.]
MHTLSSMQNRIADMAAFFRGGRICLFRFLRTGAILSLVFLSACSSRTVISEGSLTLSDSLAEAAKREFVMASLLSTKGEYRGAVDGYRKLLPVQPSNAALHYALSKAYVGLGAIDSARMYSEKSVQLSSGNKYYLRFLAYLSHQMNDYVRAADLYRQVATLEPGSTEALSTLALEYLSADQPEKALAVFQEILRIDPMNESTQAQVLLLEVKLTHYHDAIGTIKELIDQGDGREKLRLTLGELYLQTKQYDLAFKTYREVLHDNPRLIPAWLALFEVSVQSASPQTFRDDLNLFYDTNKATFEQKIELAKLFLVRSLRDSSFVEPAFVMIGEINKRHPDKSEVYVLRGKAKLQQQEVESAVGDFRKALALEPANLDIWEDLVIAHLRQKKFREAEATLFMAKKRFPSKALRLRVLEGEMLFQSGKARQAVLLLEGVVLPKNARKEKVLYLQAGSTLALCYDKLGFADKCVRLYETMLEIDPDNILMMNNLAFVFAEQARELPRARELAMKVVAAEPGNAGYLDTLGWVLFRMGEYEKAREILEKAVALDSREAEILDHLAEVYQKLGNLQKAEEMRQKSSKLKEK